MGRRNGVCRTVGYLRPDGSEASFSKPLTQKRGKVAVRQLREKDARAEERRLHGSEAERELEQYFTDARK